jgi:hypothetical protein
MPIKLCGTMTAIEWACSTDARSCLKPSRSPATASSRPSMSREYYKLSWPFFDQARVTHKMDFCEDPTLKHLHALLTDEANHSAFDFVFVDADSQTDDSSPINLFVLYPIYYWLVFSLGLKIQLWVCQLALRILLSFLFI